MDGTSSAKAILRWAALAPGAIAAGWLAWVLVNFLNRLTMSFQGLDPNSFLGRAYIETLSGLIMGAAFVYVGAKIAPAHNKNVSFVLAGIAFMMSGIALFPAIVKPDYWAIWSGLCVGFGAGSVVYSISKGQINLEA
ncbi:MAG: hypothetical protein BVN29_04810 [Nitrospira sp. ST-bin5]|nr:MAG: hypothetical protein BVN29_04810 [Nitrospira sp. ST-bin5]